ncbi:oxidoreductase [Exidia glandulosa HHB12029]|uniref:Oxidoreductase n=1 Tax=Exidia glandulosa HHB12029 TaxID=1314781 RepID=A0A165JCP7_EXIGL|nr:oxidoreductase [Exidia glandulosa HHB12029]
MSPLQSFGFSTTADEVANVFADRIKGRVFLVTGPSPNGIGDATARALARGHPAALLLVGRNPMKYAPVVDAIHTIDSSISVSVYGIDFGSLTSVRNGAQKILGENKRIDVLINSAGTAGMPLTYTADGIEETFSTNYVGHFLLTNLLMPALKRSEETRVVNVSSVAAFAASGDYTDFNFKNEPSRYTWEVAYRQSKLVSLLQHHTSRTAPHTSQANIHFTRALAKRGIVSFALQPGLIWDSNLYPVLSDEQMELIKSRVKDNNLQSKTPSQGASTSLVAALDPDLARLSGSYLDDCQVAEMSEAAKKESAAEELWTLSETLVGQEFRF